MYPSKHCPWTFRLETGCRYHKSHLLCGETEADSRSWINTIAARIHPDHSSQLCAPGEHHLKQYYQHHSNNNVDDDDIDEDIISDYGSSVLDKWLERLDLQDDPSRKSTSTIATVTPSSTISTSIPTSTTSIAAGPLSTSLPALSSTISTTDETLSRPPSSNSMSSNSNDQSNNNNSSSASAALADVFAQTRAAVKRRITVSNGSQSPPPPPPPPPVPIQPLAHRSEDVFHFEQHESSEQRHPITTSVQGGDRYSRTAMMIPPSRPPPQTALPPPPFPPRPNK